MKPDTRARGSFSIFVDDINALRPSEIQVSYDVSLDYGDPGEVLIGSEDKIAVLSVPLSQAQYFGGLIEGSNKMALENKQVWVFAPTSLFRDMQRFKDDVRRNVLVCEGNLNTTNIESVLRNTAKREIKNVLQGNTPTKQFCTTEDLFPLGVNQKSRSGQRTDTLRSVQNWPCVHWINYTDRAKKPSGYEKKLAEHLEKKGIPFETQVIFPLPGKIPNYTADFWLERHKIVIEPHGFLTEDFVDKMSSFKSACPHHIAIIMCDNSEDATKFNEEFYDYLIPYHSGFETNFRGLDEILFKLGVTSD